MITTISPLVQVGPAHWRKSAFLHVTGSSVGGMTIFGVLGVLGHFLFNGVYPPARWAIACLITLLLVCHDFGLLTVPLPRIYRSVPQSWWTRFGPNRAAFAYGLILGIGITTFIPFMAFYAILVWALLMANPEYGLIIGFSYGLARSLPVVIAGYRLLAMRGSHNAHIIVRHFADRIYEQSERVRMINRLADACAMGAVVVAVVVSVWK